MDSTPSVPQRTQGEVHKLPPDDLADGDRKWRRHVLVSQVRRDSQTVVLAFASTKGAEASHGAKHYLVDPAATQYEGSGFTDPTYIYLSRLFAGPVDCIAEPVGHVREAVGPLLRLLKLALGIGTGTCAQGPAAGSCRGRIAQLWPSVAKRMGTPYALVITEARYSDRRRYQTVIPLLDRDQMLSEPGDVTVDSAPWLTELGLKDGGILAVGDITTLYHGHYIEKLTKSAVDAQTIRAVDDAMCGLFGL